MPSGMRDKSRARLGFTHGQRQPAQIVTVQRQDIESIELHLVVTPTRMQRIEIGDAVDTEQHGLAIDD